jgi:hypothetical protein
VYVHCVWTPSSWCPQFGNTTSQENQYLARQYDLLAYFTFTRDEMKKIEDLSKRDDKPLFSKYFSSSFFLSKGFLSFFFFFGILIDLKNGAKAS